MSRGRKRSKANGNSKCHCLFFFLWKHFFFKSSNSINGDTLHNIFVWIGVECLHFDYFIILVTCPPSTDSSLNCLKHKRCSITVGNQKLRNCQYKKNEESIRQERKDRKKNQPCPPHHHHYHAVNAIVSSVQELAYLYRRNQRKRSNQQIVIEFLGTILKPTMTCPTLVVVVVKSF